MSPEPLGESCDEQGFSISCAEESSLGEGHCFYFVLISLDPILLS